VVLASDRPRFFSPGFDVTEVFTYDRERIGLFLNQFALFMDHLQWMAKPTVAALSGHTYAGGALAALCTDFRLMADSPEYGFALTEVNIGVRLPASVFLLLASAAGIPLARRAFLTGDAIRPAEGLTAGLFHALYPEAEVRAQAVALAAYLATKPPATYAAIKEKTLAAAGLRRLDADTNWIDPEAWFTPEAEQMKRQLAERLKR
jgi:3,2-trans-enoyl-CoA isomerase